MKKNQHQLLEYIVRNEVRKALRENKVHESVNLYNIFAQPIKDIFDTASAELQKTRHVVASTIGSLAKQTVMFLLPYVPGLTDAKAMARVSEKHKDDLKQKLGEIDDKYADVFQRNWDAIAGSDLGPLLFLANPQLALGGMLFAKGGKILKDDAITALSIADSLVGGSRYIQSAIAKLQGATTQYGQAVARRQSHAAEVDPYAGGYGGGDDGAYFMEQAQATSAKQPDYKSYVEQILNNPEVQAAMKSSKAVALMQQTAVSAIIDNAAKLLNFSYEDLKRNAGQEYQKQMEQLKKTPGFENKNLDQDKQFQDMVVGEIKKTIRQKATQQLQALASQNSTLGPIVKNAIAQIQKL